MAWYDWFRPLGVGASDQPAERQATYLNLLLPFMGDYERAAAATHLRGLDSPDVRGALTGGYNFAPAGATAEGNWLGGLSNLKVFLQNPNAASVLAPGWAGELASLKGDPNLEWFQSLGDVAASLGPNSTRAQQRDAKRRFDTWMEEAPEDMRAVGSYLLNPYLDGPQYGAAATFGSYRSPYQVKGGLVANPWYV